MPIADGCDDGNCEQKSVWEVPEGEEIPIDCDIIVFIISIFLNRVFYRPVFCPALNFSIIVEVTCSLEKINNLKR